MLLFFLDETASSLLEAVDEERSHVKPYFSKTIQDIEVVEDSAARFDCKIEGIINYFRRLHLQLSHSFWCWCFSIFYLLAI